MYSIAITPLIHRLEDEGSEQVWLADDATSGETLTSLRTWWDRLTEIGQDYGYYPNASKTWLIVKEGSLEEATAIFEGTDVTITVKGRRHLGAAIGTSTFIQNYIQQKVSTWIREVEYLSSNAAYAAFTHDQINKCTYLSRTIPDIDEFLQPARASYKPYP